MLSSTCHGRDKILMVEIRDPTVEIRSATVEINGLLWISEGKCYGRDRLSFMGISQI